MFPITRCIILLFFAPLFVQVAFAQVDPVKRDSLAGIIDSSVRALRSFQDNFSKEQDSIRHATLAGEKFTPLPGHNQNVVLVRERRKKQTLTGILIGSLVLIVVVIMIRKRIRRAGTS